MKSVLISIKPKWCELIADGKKTVEVRKTKPKIKTPFKCYIYCTKDGSSFPYIAGGKIIGEFICNEIIEFFYIGTDKWAALAGNAHENLKRIVTQNALLTEEQMLDYGGKYGCSNAACFAKKLVLL